MYVFTAKLSDYSFIHEIMKRNNLINGTKNEFSLILII